MVTLKTMQVMSGRKELYKGHLKLSSDWYTTSDPVRAPVTFRDSSRLAQLHNSALDPDRHAGAASPVLPVEVCVLRLRGSRWREEVVGAFSLC